MASFRGKIEHHLDYQIYAIYDEEDPAAIQQGSTFQRVMVFDTRKISDSTINIYNEDTGDSFDYQIFGSNKFVAIDDSTAPLVTDESWINILNFLQTGNKDPLDPANNDQTFSRTIPARTAILGFNYESFSNKWSFVDIRARTAKVGGLNAKLWHRGTNEGH